MAKTALTLTPEERKSYRPAEAFDRQRVEGSALLKRRYEDALKLARQAAELLRTQFGAQKVLLFGSLVHPGWFTRWSDIDLAAWEIPPERFYAAVAMVTGLSPMFKIDLVDIETCHPGLRESILREGQEI